VSGGDGAGRDEDCGAPLSLVVAVSSGAADPLVVVGGAVDSATVVRVGTGAGTLTAARPGGTAAVVVVATDPTDAVVVDPGLDRPVGGPRVVELVVGAGGLVTMVTLSVTGLTVDLSVDVVVGVTPVVTATLGVDPMSVVGATVVVILAGVDLSADAKRVVTTSWTVVGLGTAEEVVVECGGDPDGGGGVVAVVVTSALPVAGCVVSVTGCTAMGLSVVVTTPGGALVELVVRSVSGTPGAGGGEGVARSILLVVVAISAVEISGSVVVVVVVVTAAGAEVTEVTNAVDVTGRRGASVAFVEVTSRTTVLEVTSGSVFPV